MNKRNLCTTVLAVTALLMALAVPLMAFSFGATAAAAPKNGWERSGQWYYCYKDGKKLTGWQQVPLMPGAEDAPKGGKPWYYFNPKATKAIPQGDCITNELVIGGVRYYVHENGLYRGWYYGDYHDTQQKKKVYFFCYGENTGTNRYGWINDKGPFSDKQGWRYANKDNTIAEGWKKIKYNGSEQWFYFRKGASAAKPDGLMVTGWQQDGGKWYYLNPAGNMRTGWLHNNSRWYYLASNGKMLTGWQQISYRGKKEWFFFTNSGAMVTGKYTINGYEHSFDGNGVWQG